MIDQTLDRSSTEVKPQIQSTELVACFVKSPGRRETLRFLPRCSGCGKILFNIEEANCAAVADTPTNPQRVGVHEVTLIGPAEILCWPCDSKKNHVPWANALGTFRSLDEPQRFPEPIRVVTR